MVDISNMGDESLDKICRDIEKKKIQVLVTYSSALTALTQYIRKTGRDISRWSVEMVFSMGEALPQETYDLTKELFGFLRYGPMEIMKMALLRSSLMRIRNIRLTCIIFIRRF